MIVINVDLPVATTVPVSNLNSVLSHAEIRALRKPLRSRAVRRYLQHFCYMGIVTWNEHGFRWSEMGRGLRESPPMWRGIVYRNPTQAEASMLSRGVL